MRTLRHRWQTIVLTGSLSLITGLGVGWYVAQNVRPTLSPEFRGLLNQAITCQPCHESVVVDLVHSSSAAGLESVLCEAGQDLASARHSTYLGPQVRLEGLAVDRGIKGGPALELPDGTVVAVLNGAFAEPKRWTADRVGRTVWVRGCLSRQNYPTSDERRQRHESLSRRQQAASNILSQSPTGDVYSVNVVESGVSDGLAKTTAPPAAAPAGPSGPE